jgi:hypothetical protein
VLQYGVEAAGSPEEGEAGREGGNWHGIGWDERPVWMPLGGLDYWEREC